MSRDTWHHHIEEHQDVMPDVLVTDTQGNVIVPDIMAYSFEERVAIAKKISAVPELLAACQAWVEYWDTLTAHDEPGDPLAKMRNRYHRRRVEQTRAALAKAGVTCSMEPDEPDHPTPEEEAARPATSAETDEF